MQPPARIGRYEVERLLGQGAMGAVYLARDPSLERLVAVKLVKDLGLESEAQRRFLERFRNEARAAARIAHPGIVQVYDVGDEPDVGPYLVFEYVKGRSLKQVLRELRRMPPEVLVPIARSVAEAIDAAHLAGIVHRDIKPDNILVPDDGRAKLADFGVARVPDAALTREGQFLGTPCYSAPETLAEGRYGPKTDLFSFAAVLYELVSGARAYPGEDAIVVAHAVLHDTPPPPSRAGGLALPAAVDEVLMRGLARDETARPASAVALVDALEAAFQGVRLGPAQVTKERSGSSRAALLAPLVLLGAGVVTAFALRGPATCVPQPVESDAGMLDAGLDATPSAAMTPERAPDAALAIAPASAPDAMLEVPDAVRVLTARELEDLAKDELDRARAALDGGDLDAAERSLRHARQLDPESSDLEELEGRLESARAQPSAEPSP